jgi:hypothetical protein
VPSGISQSLSIRGGSHLGRHPDDILLPLFLFPSILVINFDFARCLGLLYWNHSRFFYATVKVYLPYLPFWPLVPNLPLFL